MAEMRRVPRWPADAGVLTCRWLHLDLMNHGVPTAERADRAAECDSIVDAWRDDGATPAQVRHWHLRSAGTRLLQRMRPSGDSTSLPTGFSLVAAAAGQGILVHQDPAGHVSGSAAVALAYTMAIALVAIVLLTFPLDRRPRPYRVCSLICALAATAQALVYRDPNPTLNVSKKAGLFLLAAGLLGICAWASWSGGAHDLLFSAAIMTTSVAGYVIAAGSYLALLEYRADPVVTVGNMLLAHGAMSAAATAPRLRSIRWRPGRADLNG